MAAAGRDSSRSDIYYLQQIPARRSLTCSHHKSNFCKSLRHDKASESGDLRWKGWGEGWLGDWRWREMGRGDTLHLLPCLRDNSN